MITYCAGINQLQLLICYWHEMWILKVAVWRYNSHCSIQSLPVQIWQGSHWLPADGQQWLHQLSVLHKLWWWDRGSTESGLRDVSPHLQTQTCGDRKVDRTHQYLPGRMWNRQNWKMQLELIYIFLKWCWNCPETLICL